MKMYDRRHLLLSASVAVLIIIILLMGFGLIEFSIGGSADSEADAANNKTVGKDVSSEAEAAPDQFDYNRSEAGPMPVMLPDELYSTDEMENISVYESFNKAVVNITTEVVGYNWFLEPVPKEGSSGSGSIIDTRGYILTNNHVVENAYKVNVTLADGVQFEGEVIGSDPENDLAVVQFEPGDHPLVTIPFGTSENLRVGQKVLAIGNPFAFERTLTTGIISGLGRPLRNDRGMVIRDLIQTDASINPGNSGGPLLDAHGKLIGVNTMIYTPSGGSVGIGFSVPVDTAKRVVPDLIRYGFVKRGWVDIEPVQLFPSLIRYAKLNVTQGILVSSVEPGGNADLAGVRGGSPSRAVRTGNSVVYLGGDIIVAIDGEPVATLGDLYASLEKSRPGDVVTLSLVRNKRIIDLDVTLSERNGSAL